MATAAPLDRTADYDTDTVLWAEAQIALLRAGRFAEVDWDNVIEEIDGVAKTERHRLRSQIGRVIEHLFKLAYSPAVDPRQDWRDSIRDARGEIESVLTDSPSLRRAVGEMAVWATPRQARKVAANLSERGEIDRATEQRVLAHAFTVDEIVGDWFPPAR